MLHSSQAAAEPPFAAPTQYTPEPAVQALPELHVCCQPSAGRHQLEQYICAVFERTYNARVSGFMPLLAGLYQGAEPEAALGLRSAARQPLFCEQYLEHPVEYYTDALYGAAVDRSRVMELGNLAASRGGHSGILYLLVACALQAAKVDYLLFAANKAVRRSIARCGFSPRPIHSARPDSLPDGGASWGSYYESDPLVMLADIRRTVRQAATQPGMVALMAHYAGAIDTLAAAVARETR